MISVRETCVTIAAHHSNGSSALCFGNHQSSLAYKPMSPCNSDDLATLDASRVDYSEVCCKERDSKCASFKHRNTLRLDGNMRSRHTKKLCVCPVTKVAKRTSSAEDVLTEEVCRALLHNATVVATGDDGGLDKRHKACHLLYVRHIDSSSQNLDENIIVALGHRFPGGIFGELHCLCWHFIELHQTRCRSCNRAHSASTVLKLAFQNATQDRLGA
mmetsp:Transcript_13752/g.26654  ORF Transcript_13752/g.26654 Transcript_13752/m.26654 type:complete len:216 (+) Transcript_13752:547-1194(+)